MNVLTISKDITKGEDLVVIPRREYERFLSLVMSPEKVRMEDLLRWSREARRLKRLRRLPILRSLKDLR